MIGNWSLTGTVTMLLILVNFNRKCIQYPDDPRSKAQNPLDNFISLTTPCVQISLKSFPICIQKHYKSYYTSQKIDKILLRNFKTSMPGQEMMHWFNARYPIDSVLLHPPQRVVITRNFQLKKTASKPCGIDVITWTRVTISHGFFCMSTCKVLIRR